MYVKRTLHRTPDGEAAGAAGLCDHSIGFDVKLFLRSGAVFSFDDPGSVFPGLVYISLFHPVAFEDVVFAPDDELAALAFFDGVDGGCGLIADLDGRHRGCQGVPIGMRQQQDRLFRMIHHSIGQAGLVIHDERDDIAAGNIFGGDDGELVPGDAFTELDLFNRSAGNACCAPWRRRSCPAGRDRRCSGPARLIWQAPSLRGTETPTTRVCKWDLLLATDFDSNRCSLPMGGSGERALRHKRRRLGRTWLAPCRARFSPRYGDTRWRYCRSSGAQGELGIGIEDHQVRVVSRGDGAFAFVEAGELGRLRGHPARQVSRGRPRSRISVQITEMATLRLAIPPHAWRKSPCFIDGGQGE